MEGGDRYNAGKVGGGRGVNYTTEDEIGEWGFCVRRKMKGRREARGGKDSV